jgi:hypothetical protein
MLIFKNEQQFVDILNKPVRVIGELTANKESLASLHDGDIVSLPAILITSGCNKNDDYFVNSEMWEKKQTALNKPFNIEHDVRKVIGHFTDVFMLDDNRIVLSEPMETSKLHLGVQISVYRQLTPRDTEWKEKVDDLLEKMWTGELFVSSEVIFPTFDYGLLDDSGVLVETIPRDESTSFLTANLRIFGGTGRYKGYRLCRVLRDITIVGGGLVEKPANPHSVFLTQYSEDSLMPELEVLQKQNGELRAQVADLHTQLATLKEQLQNKDIKKLEDSVASLEEELKVAKEISKSEVDEKVAEIEKQSQEIESLNSAQTVIKEKMEGLVKEREELEAKLAEAVKKLEEIEVANVREKRISALVSKSMNRAEAEELVTKFANLSDEQFDSICAIIAVGSDGEDTDASDLKDGVKTPTDSLSVEKTDVDSSLSSLQLILSDKIK